MTLQFVLLQELVLLGLWRRHNRILGRQCIQLLIFHFEDTRFDIDLHNFLLFLPL